METGLSYIKAFARCALLVTAGTTLQFIAGNIDGSFLRHPWGAILAVNYIYLLVLAYAFSDRYRWLRSLWDGRACVSSIVSLLLFVIISGLIRQDGSGSGVAGALGFTGMTSTWTFNLLLLYFLTTLGIRTVAEIVHIRQDGRPARTVLHLAVFILVLAGMFGSADKIRCKIVAPSGIPVSDASGGIMLPFSLTLRNFSIDEYPPKLYVYDTVSGTSSSEFLSVDREYADAYVSGVHLKVEKYLDMAGIMPGDSVYREMNHVGAVPAAYVTDGRVSGWVSCGSHIFSAASLELGNGKTVVMSYPEAREYKSEVTVGQPDGFRKDLEIRVNHPAKIGAWRIYQAGYDTSRGKWSTVSVFECVRDPWYWLVDTALWLMLAGGILMFLTAGRRKKIGPDMKKGGER